MNGCSVSLSEMKRLGNMSDSDLEALRDGRLPNGDSGTEGLARFVRELGDAFPEPSTDALEGAHVAAMLEVAHLMAEKGESVVRPTSKAVGPDDQASGLPKLWRETMALKFKSMFATRVAKVTAAAVAMLLAFSGVAIAGVLPASVQDKVADVVQTVGIDLPGGSDEVEAPDTDEADLEDATETDIEEPAAADVEDADNDDQGEDANEADEAQEQSAADEVDEVDEVDSDDVNDAEHDAIEQPEHTDEPTEVGSDD